MMIIRSSQIEAFDNVALNKYKAELCIHLRQFDSLLCQAAGNEALNRTVDIGIGQAHKSDFILNGSIKTYLEIMITLGCEFNKDPQYFWLRPFLESEDFESENDKMRYLNFHVNRYMDNVQGIDGTHGMEVLQRVQNITREELIEIGSNYSVNSISWLESLHPLKCAFIGSDALKSLSQLAADEAKQANLFSIESASLLLGLMFAFGSGIIRDPMYPWVSQTLANSDNRVEKLYTKTKAYFRKMYHQIQGM